MPKFFVWVDGLRGPEAQIWHEMQKDYLKERYPYEAKS